MIREKLTKSGLEIRFHAVVATASRFRELLNYGCQMIHYTGHGCEEFLAFESDIERHCGLMEPLKVSLFVADRFRRLADVEKLGRPRCSPFAQNAYAPTIIAGVWVMLRVTSLCALFEVFSL